jgi:hypothetical protein
MQARTVAMKCAAGVGGNCTFVWRSTYSCVFSRSAEAQAIGIVSLILTSAVFIFAWIVLVFTCRTLDREVLAIIIMTIVLTAANCLFFIVYLVQYNSVFVDVVLGTN